MIPCACGCGELISEFDKRGIKRTYKKGHVNRTRKFWLQFEKKPCECGCGELIQCVDNHGYERRFKNGHATFGSRNGNWGKRGHLNPNWKGIKKNMGYVWLYSPNHPKNLNGYVAEHRLVMEKHLGRYLIEREEIHHINGIKTDNRIENLILFKNSQAHKKFEYEEYSYMKQLIEQDAKSMIYIEISEFRKKFSQALNKMPLP